tara:strand:+ start:157 stop:516 length:360 start_codon:yes stop_codon:yes gene_type:complete
MSKNKNKKSSNELSDKEFMEFSKGFSNNCLGESIVLNQIETYLFAVLDDYCDGNFFEDRDRELDEDYPRSVKNKSLKMDDVHLGRVMFALELLEFSNKKRGDQKVMRLFDDPPKLNFLN